MNLASVINHPAKYTNKYKNVVVQTYKTSGMSKSAYCRAIGIDVNTLKSWESRPEPKESVDINRILQENKALKDALSALSVLSR